MADIADIVKNVTTEIRKIVQNLTPQDMKTPGFSCPKRLETEDIFEITGVTRLFQIIWNPEELESGLFVGCTAKDSRINGNIVVGYPPQRKWNHAMISDKSIIFDALQQSDSTVDGIAYRHVPADAEPQIEDVDGDWRWYLIPITAHVHTP
jgi:hypothetical protein